MAKRDMSFFMAGNAKPISEHEVMVSNRYVDGEGKVIPFTLKAIPTDRLDEIEKLCMEDVKEKGRVVGQKLNYPRFLAKIGIETTVFPDFKDKELLASYKIVDPVDVVKKVLSLPGEYAKWIEEIQRINGLDDEFEDLIDEAKN